MEVAVPEYPEHLLKEIPKIAYKRSDIERKIDILRCAVSPCFAYHIVRKANTNDEQFKANIKTLISRGLISVTIAPPPRTRRKDSIGPPKPRKIYTTTPRGRIAINYWIGLCSCFEESPWKQ